MKRIALILAAGWLCLLLVTGCSATAEELTGQAEGYGGPLTVMVSMNGDRIAEVRVTQHSETDGIGTKAIDALPAAIVAANSTEIDGVSGATMTSNAIKSAVRQALDKAGHGAGAEGASPAPLQDLRTGVGICATGRVGPGKDAQDGQIYSINIVAAAAAFDAQDRIVSLAIDQIETATPNAADAGLPEFSGFPGQGGFAHYDDDAKVLRGVTDDSDERFLAEVSGWVTKGMRGDDYMLPAGSWRDQIDAYERLFTGMTVDEVETWFAAHCSDETGRPLQKGVGSEQDQAKYDELAGEAQELLDDLTSSASISLRDVHGDLLTALRRAWEDAQRAKNMR